DILTLNPVWHTWSVQALRETANSSRVVINAVVFAEASVRFSRIEDVDAALDPALERENIPFEAAFLAGKVFRAYRQRGGTRPSLLPDFLIGAHAAVRGYELLTRDCPRYRTYFPDLRLIAPD
ncbi:MAG TPA: type II toxin-antitoxin system VapC family toxin, partial [Rhizomicrobium sp.]